MVSMLLLLLLVAVGFIDHLPVRVCDGLVQHVADLSRLVAAELIGVDRLPEHVRVDGIIDRVRVDLVSVDAVVADSLRRHVLQRSHVLGVHLHCYSFSLNSLSTKLLASWKISRSSFSASRSITASDTSSSTSPLSRLSLRRATHHLERPSGISDSERSPSLTDGPSAISTVNQRPDPPSSRTAYVHRSGEPMTEWLNASTASTGVGLASCQSPGSQRSGMVS